MKGQAPYIKEVVFYCPGCGRKRSADVQVVITPEKNFFSFACEDCGRAWIVDVFEAFGDNQHPGNFPTTTEPQVEILARLTNELQPMISKGIIDLERIRIARSIGRPIEVRPLGEIKIGRAGLFDFAGKLGGWARIGRRRRR